MERLRQRGKNETKLNAKKIMKTYEKGMSSVDEKITRNNNNELRSFILHLWEVW